ncbi:Type I site-specific deoxyribonuclease [Flagellimonas maritima]|uniref:Type I site-specific deoxyribonuclease n=1 Tax=Flagellimonas maritima TaxID=1383885 RepID=A0A2Z4LPD5_9FLAO|nr:restriction endonuclease subunit S [Allomuricauda aurantiaca]AWX43620.1 Type I site-specific deoxyribonuclease [Allomuricauda aurantiaca]
MEVKKYRLTDVCDFQGGSQPPKSEWTKTLKDGYVRMLQIRDFTQPNKENIEYVRITNRIKTCKSEDILIGRYGASVGKILTGLAGAYNVAIMKTIPDQKKLLKPYLRHLLVSPSFQNYILNVGGRAAQAGFSKSDLSRFDVFLPSLENQKRIAQVLTDCEELIAKRKESIALLDELLKSTFLDMFWKKNLDYQNWERDTIEGYALKRKASMRSGPFGSSLLHEEFSESGDVKVLGIDNVVNNFYEEGKPRYITFKKYEELKRYTVHPGDVLISIMATNGRSAVVPQNIPLAINSKHLAAITLNQKKILPFYLKYSFQYHPLILKQLSKRVKGAIMSGLNLTIIKELKLPQPPLSLQEKFSSVVLKIIETNKLYHNNLLELEYLYGRLSQDVFKGELDLSKVALREEFKK